MSGGLYASEIEKMMKRHKCFKGVIAANEIKNLVVSPKMCFVMNLDERGKPGSHWVSVYIDVKGSQSVEYYDSFGREPSDTFKKDIKYLVDRLKTKYMLKFKVNKITHQDVTSDTCGFHAITFLNDRLNGKSFAEASGFKEPEGDISKEKEQQVKKMKKKFGYI